MHKVATLLFLITALTLLAAPAKADVASDAKAAFEQAYARSQMTAGDKVAESLKASGALISPEVMQQLTLQAANAQLFERDTNQYASISQSPSIGHRVLLCVKGKAAGIFMKAEIGICSDLTGTPMLLQGTGLGLAAGVAVDVMTLIYIGRFDIPVVGDYTGIGGTAGLRKSAQYALKFAKLIKSMPKMIGPDIAVYSDGLHGGGLLQLGIQFGPMVDLSGSKLTLSPL